MYNTSYVYTICIHTYIYCRHFTYDVSGPNQRLQKHGLRRSAQPEISPSFVKATNCTHRKKDRPYAMKGASLGSAKVS